MVLKMCTSFSTVRVALIPAICFAMLAGCEKPVEPPKAERQRLVVTNPMVKDVVTSQRYVCQIHSRRHIEVRAMESGYLAEIRIEEGQPVKKGDLMFRVLPTLYQAKYETVRAEARKAQIEYDNTKRLLDDNVVSDQELAIVAAKLAHAKAELHRSSAELEFTRIKASFDGIVDRLRSREGSLVNEGDILTTLSDNVVMWVYFNVPEARYLNYQTGLMRGEGHARVELILANGEKFNQPGKIAAIEADFDNKTGNLPFRADFPNPDGLLRNGQTGNVIMYHDLKDAMVIPQRATFEVLDKQFVFVIDENETVRQREIEVAVELEDIFVVRSGLTQKDKIVLDGKRQVRDGDKSEYEFRSPSEVMKTLKKTAE